MIRKGGSQLLSSWAPWYSHVASLDPRANLPLQYGSQLAVTIKGMCSICSTRHPNYPIPQLFSWNSFGLSMLPAAFWQIVMYLMNYMAGPMSSHIRSMVVSQRTSTSI